MIAPGSAPRMKTFFEIFEPRLAAPLADAGLRRYDDFLDCRFGEPVHVSSTTSTSRIAIDGGVFFLKAYRFRTRRPRPFRRHKALREARNYRRMRSLDLNVPAVAAVGARARFAAPIDGFILTQEVPAARSADEYFAAHWGRPASTYDPRRRLLLDESADMIANMHAAHFYHVDLQWRNILISDESGRADPFLIDCARGGFRIHPLTRAHGRLRDLSSLYKEARIHLSRTESARWLRRYFRVRRFTIVHRAIIHAIVRDRALKDGPAAS